MHQPLVMRARTKEARLESIRAYLRRAFPGWQLSDAREPRRDAHFFRLARPGEPLHLLTVHGNVLDKNAPADLLRLLTARGVGRALREAPGHCVLLAKPLGPSD